VRPSRRGHSLRRRCRSGSGSRVATRAYGIG
jgi:hypothetical protein